MNNITKDINNTTLVNNTIWYSKLPTEDGNYVCSFRFPFTTSPRRQAIISIRNGVPYKFGAQFKKNEYTEAWWTPINIPVFPEEL